MFLAVWWWLPESLSNFSFKIDLIFYVVLAITGIIFFLVEGALVYFLIRYRARAGERATYVHGSKRVEIIWTLIPAFIMVFLALLSQTTWSQIKGANFPAQTFNVEIEAEQFAWNIRYPGADGKFKTQDDITAINQLHIPVGEPVRVRLRSISKEDKPAVIHSFFLPQFRVKQDVVPGMDIDIWFQAKRTGQFEIACAEFCGLGHYRMRGFLTVETPEAVNQWLEEETKALQGGVA